MADNVAITAGSGTAIATDDVSSVHYQRVKLDVGADGASVPVVGTLPVLQSAATATLSNVASSASSVTLLALNTARRGAAIHNDSTAILYVKFGTTASTSSYTVQMPAGAHYEVPFGYTGRIDGIWASANGNARVTELT